MAFARPPARRNPSPRAVGAALCAATLLWLLPGAARADNRSLILTDKSRQSVADIDFAQPPIWKTPAVCDVRDVHDGCRLARMTAEPTGTDPAEIVATALRIAQRVDSVRDQSIDGYTQLRAAEAYLVAAAFEAQSDRLADARAHFKLALSRAADVPRSLTKFSQTYSGLASLPSMSSPYSNPGTIRVGATSKEETDVYYAQAQLVREYALRALSAVAER